MALILNDPASFAEAALANKGWAFGPSYLGPTVDHVLLGIVICQVLYWKLWLAKTERWEIKCLIVYLLVAAIGHSAYTTAYGMTVFVYGYGDPTVMLRGWWVKGACLLELFIAMPIEAFYSTRAYALWNRPLALRIILPVLFLSCVVLGLYTIIAGPSDPVYAVTAPVFLSWGAILFTIDWFLSLLIIIKLIQSRAGFAHSDKVVRKIIVMSAEAQLVPSLITLGILLNSAIAARNLMTLFFGWVPKAWIITFMTVINARRDLRRDMENERQRRQNTLNFVTEDVQNTSLIVMSPESTRGVHFNQNMFIKRSNSQNNNQLWPTTEDYSLVEKGIGQTVSNPTATIPELELAYVTELPTAANQSALRRYRPPSSGRRQSNAGRSSNADGVGTEMSFEEMLGMAPER